MDYYLSPARPPSPRTSPYGGRPYGVVPSQGKGATALQKLRLALKARLSALKIDPLNHASGYRTNQH